MWSCPHLPLLTSRVETSNRRTAENQDTPQHFRTREQARAAKARPQQKCLSHIYKRKMHDRNAEYADIPDRVRDRAQSFLQNKFLAACDIQIEKDQALARHRFPQRRE